MKNLTAKQIAQVKTLNEWTLTRFHGNTKKVGDLYVSDLKAIVEKKHTRMMAKLENRGETEVQRVRRLIQDALRSKGTNYFKIMIEGNTGIYFASPVYGHSDYNKTRLFSKNERTLKLMTLFNSIVNK